MALTEVDDLIVRIEHDPDNVVLAAMLVDELIEARGMYRWEAMLHVQRVQSTAHDVRDIAFTTGLIRAKGPAFDALCAEVRTCCGLYGHESFTLFVIAGDDEPRVGVPVDQAGQGMIAAGYAVSLPATWVRNWRLRTGHPIRLKWPRSRVSQNRNVRGPRHPGNAAGVNPME